MGGLVLAWLAGESLLIWRWAKAGAPPTPGALAESSLVYLGLAVLAQAEQARTTATVLAWGYNIAILMQVSPGSKVAAQTNWPPPVITDPSVILPTGNSHTAAAPYGNQSGGSATNGGSGGPVPSGPNTTVPGTPAAPNQGVIFPPGSGNL